MISKNLKDTRNLATRLVVDKKRVFALVGDLGVGKTTFVQAFLRELGVRGRVISPTFLLIKRYEVDKKNIYHIDAYRIQNEKELIVLGLKDILKDKNNIVLIEWADKIRRLVPKNAVWVYFEHGDKKKERIIKIENRFPPFHLRQWLRRDTARE